ncbi:MAG: hypothetical protein JJU02_04075 [Cryomorphaceae bacterium]|nr:hypothetical protein [Cryomorphaceae bacterium]
MKYYYTTFIFLICFVNLGLAQSKHRGAMSYGYSKAMGDFGSKSPDNPSAGYANGGVFALLSYSHTVYKNFGIIGLIQTQSISTDYQNLADEVSRQVPKGNGDIRNGLWRSSGYFLGVSHSYGISSKWHLESRVALGINDDFFSPGFIAVDLYGPPDYPSWIIQQSATQKNRTFALMLGIDFNYEVEENISLIINIDYFNAKPEFNDVETLTNLERTENDFRQSVKTINCGIGIAVKF